MEQSCIVFLTTLVQNCKDTEITKHCKNMQDHRESLFKEIMSLVRGRICKLTKRIGRTPT